MIFEVVQEVIAKQLHIDPSEITMDSHLRNDLNADSIDAVDIIMELEDRFNIEFNDEDLERLETIRNVVEYIETHTSEDDDI